MANLFRLLPDAFFKDLENDLTVSVVLSLQRNSNIVSAKTSKSVRSETSLDSSRTIANISGFGGGGLPFITKDKPANTKFPMKKVGDRFELVPDLKNWKALTGFGGSDFLLARSIAKNPRRAIDIAGPAMDIFLKRSEKKILNSLVRIVGKEIVDNFNKDKS